MNIKLATSVLKQLVSYGVKDFVCCAGARNAPLVEVLSKSTGVRVTSFYEERSASFLALGMSQASKRPVVVCTTSGTAAAEVLPAVVEAFYTNTPLIVLTADRPRSYRGSGAPQTIEHVGLFSHYVHDCFDIETLEDFEKFESVLANKSIVQPLHINICFDEPLIDEKLEDIDLSLGAVVNKSSTSMPVSQVSVDFKQLDDFFESAKRPVVILSKVNLSKTLLQWLESLDVPIFAESTFGSDLKNANLMSSHELLLKNKEFKKSIDSVVRIGNVPTMRFWRDLEAELKHLPVLSISDTTFSGLSRVKSSAVDSEDFCQYLQKATVGSWSWSSDELNALSTKNAQLLKAQNDLIQKYPLSEAALVWQLSQKVSCKELVFIGNSLAIREWDQFSSLNNRQSILANRGANGIDGLISTFVGHLAALPKSSGLCLLGDLSLKYDFAGLDLLEKIDNNACVVVINNKGGKIFSRIFNNQLFENEHNDNYEFIAKHFKLNYFGNENWQQGLDTHRSLIELVPDVLQSQNFWNEWDQLWH